MISGYNHLTQQQENRQLFLRSINNTQIWEKPDGANFVHIFGVGGGGGGGGAGINGSGASGGSAACYQTLLIPASLIPSYLFINIGAGGTGGTATAGGSFGGLGNTGGSTSVATSRVFDISSCLISPNGGTGGTGSTGGCPGQNPTTPSVIGLSQLASLGKWTSLVAGPAGGTCNPGINASATNVFSGGGGGGGDGAGASSQNGGAVISAYKQPSAITVVTGGITGTSITAAGNNGWGNFKDFIFYGGSGGASNPSGNTGGRGGDGFYGCGGGGGGCSKTTGSGGVGGNGGDGFVIITCW